jgi:hypothetical protein
MLRSWRELRDARRKGRRDGRAGVPGTGQDALPFDLLGIMARAQERAQRALQRWRTLDRERQRELADREQRAVAAAARLAEAEAQRDDALAEHERHSAQEQERLARLQARLEELPAEAEAPSFAPGEPELPAPVPLVAPIAGGSPSHPALVRSEPPPEREPEAVPTDVTWRGFGPLVYWSLIALIVIGEIPLNAFAFRLFHEPDLLTYAMTVTVAVGLIAFAHAVGLFLSRPERTGVERVLIGVFVALPVAAIAVISLVRFGYLVDVGGDTGIGPLLGTFAFGLINLLVFGAAAGLSYLHHDPRTLVNRRAAIRAVERERSRAEHRREEQERRRRDREQRTLDEQRRRDADLRRGVAEQERERTRRELELRAERHRAELEARKNEALLRREHIADAMRLLREAASERVERLTELHERVHAARTELGEARRAVETLGAERRALWEATSAELAQIRASRDRLVFAYCSANVRARAGHATPECLRAVPPLAVPPEFEDATAEAA